MRKVIALTDYKNHFGSKWEAKPYRSGFDKRVLSEVCQSNGIDIEFVKMQEVDLQHDRWKGQDVVYTSSEESGLYYKNFIEDVVLALQLRGARPIPNYSYLRANNNKVYMELLRDLRLGEELTGFSSHIYGTLEELEADIEKGVIEYPCVVKQSAGAMSRGVFLAQNTDECLKYAKKASNTFRLKAAIKEKLRTLKHKGYKPESQNQNKFIVQPFIPGLSNDWKVLIFGDHYYVLQRGIKENDFRASGSGYNYKAGSDSRIPISLLDWIKTIYDKFNVPHLSLDVAYDGNRGYLFEFQAVYFGTATHSYSDDYYTFENGSWVVKEKKLNQEEEHAWGLAHYLNNKKVNRGG